MEKEEELVMMDKALADRAAALLAADPPAAAPTLSALCHALAKFHGELVLLEHWCSLNYAALVKILKKHDKRSSLSLRLPILVSVLRQPFYSTEILSQLVKATEGRFHALAARLRATEEAAAAAAAAAAAPPHHAPPAASEPTANGGGGGDGADSGGGGVVVVGGGGGGAALEPPRAAAFSPLPPLMSLPSVPAVVGPADGGARPEEEASMLARTRAALSCWEQLKKSQSLGSPAGWAGAAAAAGGGGSGGGGGAAAAAAAGGGAAGGGAVGGGAGAGAGASPRQRLEDSSDESGGDGAEQGGKRAKTCGA